MAPTFLERIADELLSRHSGNDYTDYSLVFPTRRAALIFKLRFSEKLNRPAFLPACYSIGDYVAAHFPSVIADRKELLLELFALHKTYFPSIDYSSFVAWGEMMQNDFEEIDRYLIDADLLYAELKVQKEIDDLFETDPEQALQIKKFWSLFTDKEPSRLKTNFLHTWQVLPKLYHGLQATLAAKNKTTEGHAYRMLAMHPEKYLTIAKVQATILAGFYALTPAEQKLFEYVSSTGGTILWDADNYYTDQVEQEAGFYFRQNPLTQGDFKWKENYLNAEKKQIHITGSPLVVGQIKGVANTLSAGIKDGTINLNKTAIILSDETLLPVLLQSLPNEISALNVTMGYPFSSTPLYRFIKLLLQMKNKSVRKEDGWYLNIESLQEVFLHPYAHAFFQSTKNIIKDGAVYFTKLSDVEMDDANMLLEWLEENNNTVFQKYSYWFQKVINYLDERNETLQKEIASFIRTEVEELALLTQPFEMLLDASAKEMLVQDIFDSSRLPFSGEPVKGLQVMGFLETRTLDFETIFIVGVNEGSMPKLSKHNSFIPFNLRKGFKLPTYEEQDAISAYHFWRLFQRSTNIHLVYNTLVNEFAGGEKSRYLLQLFYELQPAMHQHWTFTHRLLATPMEPVTLNPPSFLRTDALTKKLVGLYATTKKLKFSATSLQSFINCSLQFYFRYIEKIKEPEEYHEQIDGAMFGEIFHQTVEKLYASLNGKIFSASDAASLKKQIQPIVLNALKDKYDFHYNQKGFAFLIEKIIVRYVQYIIDTDLQSETFAPIAFEKEVVMEHPIREGISVLVKGKFDRLDKLRNAYRIVDYKTGNDTVEKQKSGADVFSNIKLKVNLQLLLYVWLAEQSGFDLPVNAGIYPLRRMTNGIEYVEEGYRINNNTMLEFEQGMTTLIDNILYTTDFVQTEDVKRCQYCPYKTICNR